MTETFVPIIKEGTGKGVAWVKSNFGSKRAGVIIDQAEKFLDNMNFRIIGKGSLQSAKI